MNEKPENTFCNRTQRREFLKDIGGGFASLGLTGMLAQDGFFANKAMAKGASSYVNPLAPKHSAFTGKAKSVIFLFMYGGPSQVDTFDYKPNLYPLDGKTIQVKTFGRGGKRNESRVVGPKWKFKPYGECGKYVSDLFPHVGSCVDDIAFLHSMKAESPIHGSAMLMMNAGNLLSGHPSLGSWVNYGLGSVNENLPGYVVMLDKTGGPISGAKNWSSGYMPASYQGTVLRSQGSPILDLENSHGIPRPQQRTMLDHLRTMNEGHLSERYDNTNLAWWWLLVSVGLSGITCLVIALEMLLSHDAELLHRITRFARTFQLVLVLWLWGLLLWSVRWELDLRGAEPFLEVVVVWVTMFTGIEIFSRFRLGRIRWNGGSALDKLRGVTALLTEVEITEMKANSSQIMSSVRWALHGLTLAWLCVLLAFGQGVGPEEFAIDEWGRPTLWLAAMYALMFGSESWLRMRGRMPSN